MPVRWPDINVWHTGFTDPALRERKVQRDCGLLEAELPEFPRAISCDPTLFPHLSRFWRRWKFGPQVLFIMLNPSTADELRDDPTIGRCIGFARSWGFGSLAVGNLLAYRTTSPGELCASRDPVGSENDRWLTRLHEESTLTIAAWGNHGRLLGSSGPGGPRGLLPSGSRRSVRALSGIRLVIS